MPREGRRQFHPGSRAAMGLLATALDEDYASMAPESDGAAPVAEEHADIAIVAVRGPLDHHDEWWFDSYDSIVERVGCALDEPTVRALILRIDSPGGQAAGMIETARTIRRMCDELDVALYAYADEMACSAAYGLACAAEEIWCPESGCLGSIGCIMRAVDLTGVAKREGAVVKLIKTGDRKGDGDPFKALDKDVEAALQAAVDAYGQGFFEHVASSRKLSVEDVRGMQAGVYFGAAAQRVGLADGIASWDDFLAMVVDSLDAAS